MVKRGQLEGEALPPSSQRVEEVKTPHDIRPQPISPTSVHPPLPFTTHTPHRFSAHPMASTRRVAAVQNSHSNSHNNNNNDAGMEESPHHVSARTWRPTRRGGRRPLRHTPTRHTPNSTSRQPLRASSLSGQREKGARSGGNAGGTASDSAGGDSHATRRRRALPSSIPRVFMRGVLVRGVVCVACFRV